MTISSTARKAGPFSGTGAQTSFPFNFKVFAPGDVLVVQTDSAGVERALTLGSAYSVSLNTDQDGNPGGTVTLPSPLPAANLLTLSSAVQATQGVSIPNMGGFYPRVVEQALDKITIVAQQMADAVSRSIRFAISDSNPKGDLPTAAARAGRFFAFDASGNPTVASGTGADAALRTDLASAAGGAALVQFSQPGGVARTALAKLRELAVSVTDFGADPTGLADSTAAFQAAVAYFQAQSAGYNSPFVTIRIPLGTYKILGTVNINYSANVMQLCFETDGAQLVGAGANTCLNFNNGGYRNVIKKLTFTNFGKAISWSTNNRNESQLRIENCTSGTNDVFLDTVSYAASRSSMIHISDMLVVDTRVMVNHYTDQMTVENCWLYAKVNSLDALLYLSGDGNVHIKDTFLIPNASQAVPVSGARWIDFVSDPAQCTPGDRSLKTLKLSGVRQSLESARPLIWTFDTCSGLPNGNNQVSSITIEDSSCPGTGGYALVRYKQGYPGSVNLRNVKVFASSLCDVDAGNTAPPVPSIPGAITYHVISVDEATRLSQDNGNNNALIIDPKLEPFVYDTTTQTSKYKTSIPKNIDYRLRTVNAPGAGAGKVKATIPVFFDSNPAVANRDILTFLLVTVGDANASIYSGPTYRATSVTLVTVVGGNNSGVAYKRITTTVLQDAKGGISFTDSSAAPTVFWGQGDTGSIDIVSSSTTGTEDFMTMVWSSSDPSTSWAYIVPLAGIRANQQDKMQFNVW